MTSKDFIAKFLQTVGGTSITEAFQESAGLNECHCEWTSEDDIMHLTSRQKNTVYILEEFENPAFDHLQNLGYTCFGPLCLLGCMKYGEALPKGRSVYSLAMTGLTISCSSLSRDVRDKIHQRVQWMNGEVSKDLHQNVSHLVTGEVGSKKYLVAANLRKPIMTTQWVENMWSKSKTELVHANDAAYIQDYRCPTFLGCVISVSGLEADEREQLRETVRNNGGKYSGELRLNECTHLILRKPEGQKYEFACKFKIQTVNPQWITDSVKSGYFLDEHPYKVPPSGTDPKVDKLFPKKASTSTPKEGTGPSGRPRASSAASFDLSTIDFTHVNETKCVTNQSFEPSITGIGRLESLSSIDLTTPNRSQCLKGTKIYLSGFNNEETVKAKKLISLGSGCRFNTLNEMVTHIIAGRPDENDIQIYESLENKPEVVTIQWLVDSVASEESKATDAYSTLLTMSASSTELSNNTVKAPANASAVADLDETTKDATRFQLPARETSGKLSQSKDESTISEGDLLFAGYFFVVCGFNTEHTTSLKEYIEKAGGKVLTGKHAHIPDFAVVPIFGCSSKPAAKFHVTNTWLQTCVEDVKLVSPNANLLFTPINSYNEGSKPLKDCVISVSGYVGAVRDTLLYIAELLGATCQEYFVRKNMDKNNLLANTHLVASIPEGSKYNAAVKWGIFAVSAKWLIDCAKENIKCAESAYPVIAQSDEDSTLNTTEEGEAAGHDGSFIDNHRVQNPSTAPSASVATPKQVPDVPFAAQANNSVRLTPISNGFRDLRIRNGHAKTPIGSDGGWETPSKFCVEGVDFQPNYDFAEAFQCVENMKTPTTSHGRKSSLISEEYVQSQLSKAIQQVTEQKNTPKTPLSQRWSVMEESPAVFQPKKPLAGLVIYVAKKLTAKQAEYNKICAELGADYKWTYDQLCTHFIFQGKKNDSNKEYRTAREQKKFIVSPSWLLTCQKENRRVDESLFPHTHNPQMTLAMETPPVSRRPATRAAAQQLPDSGKENNVETKQPSACSLTTEKDDTNLRSLNEESARNDDRMEESTLDTSRKSLENKSANFAQSLHQLMQQEQNKSPGSNGRPATRNRSHESWKPVMMKPMDTEPSQQYDIGWYDPHHRAHLNQDAAMEVGKMHADGSLSENPVGKGTRAAMQSTGNANKAPSPMQWDTMETADADGPSVAFPWPERPSDTEKPAEIDSLQALLDSEMKEAPSAPPVFLLSGLQPHEKDDYHALIEQLGGQILESAVYDPRCTHLVVEIPARNEKFLSSVASGKWVLHKSYFEACRQSETLVDERDYEWGCPSVMLLIEDRPAAVKLAKACTRWREKVQQQHQAGQLGGAFRGWRVLLMVDKRKEESIGRVLQAGGAELIDSARLPSDLKSISHCLVDVKSIGSQKDFVKTLMSAGVHCCKPEYISDYLNDDPPPPPENHYVQLNATQKRPETSASETSDAKKKRKQ